MWAGPYGEWGGRKYVLASLDQSLKRMGLDYVDIFYSHRFDPDTPLEETMGALDHAVRSARLSMPVSRLQFSVREAADILKQLGTPCVIHQPSYSMLNRWVEDEGCSIPGGALGVGSIVFSPLAQGMLTDKYLGGIPEVVAPQGKSLKSAFINDKTIANIKALNAIAGRRGQTLAQMAWPGCWRKGRVTSALIAPAAGTGRGLRRCSQGTRLQRCRTFRDRYLRASPTSICGRFAERAVPRGSDGQHISRKPLN
jgi:L-glyceraldehyde 3-phosphate reductase